MGKCQLDWPLTQRYKSSIYTITLNEPIRELAYRQFFFCNLSTALEQCFGILHDGHQLSPCKKSDPRSCTRMARGKLITFICWLTSCNIPYMLFLYNLISVGTQYPVMLPDQVRKTKQKIFDSLFRNWEQSIITVKTNDTKQVSNKSCFGAKLEC